MQGRHASSADAPVPYRHPGGSKECITHFQNILSKNLNNINGEHKGCIVTGDINIDGLKIHSNDFVNDFFDGILENNFIPTITVPTRITDNTATLIDHIFINNKMIQKSPDIESGVIYCGLTDHLPIFINLTIDCPLKSHKRPIIRIYGDKNMKKFCEKLEKTNWDELYEENNVNKALEIFYKNFNHAYQTSFPLKQLSRKRAKDSNGLLQALKEVYAQGTNSTEKPTGAQYHKQKKIHRIQKQPHNIIENCSRNLLSRFGQYRKK